MPKWVVGVSELNLQHVLHSFTQDASDGRREAWEDCFLQNAIGEVRLPEAC